MTEPSPVLSVVTGTNADLIGHIAPLYIGDGAKVRDVTWGKGAFWNGVDTSRFDLIGSDIADHIGGHDNVVKADFRDLPYDDDSVDVLVLDPPYVHNPGKHATNARYNNESTTAGMYHRDIRELYREGMIEAWRVLAPGGQMWVKCKDELESGIQCWSHIEALHDAQELGFYGKDMFILVPDSRTSMRRWNKQLHARKVHSYLWVFVKPIPRNTRPRPLTAQQAADRAAELAKVAADAAQQAADASALAASLVSPASEGKDVSADLNWLHATAGLTWKQIAEAVGVSQTKLYRWRSDTPAPLDVAQRIITLRATL